MDRVLEAGRLVKITTEIILPVAATLSQIEEWVNHEIFEQGSCSLDNPLLPTSPSVFGYVWLTDPGVRGIEKRTLIKEDPNGTKH